MVNVHTVTDLFDAQGSVFLRIKIFDNTRSCAESFISEAGLHSAE